MMFQVCTLELNQSTENGSLLYMRRGLLSEVIRLHGALRLANTQVGIDSAVTTGARCVQCLRREAPCDCDCDATCSW